MAPRTSQVDLEARLKAAGEQSSFTTRGPGHLQHRCVEFQGAIVNFWPSTGSWNIQGQGHHKVALECLLKQPATTSNVVTEQEGSRVLTDQSRPACTASGAPCHLSALSSKAASVRCPNQGSAARSSEISGPSSRISHDSSCETRLCPGMGDTTGEVSAVVSLNDIPAKVSSSSVSTSYVPKSSDEPLLATVSKQLMDVVDAPIAVERCPQQVARGVISVGEGSPVEAVALEEPLCSESVRSIEGTFGEDIKKLIEQSFGQWRGEQQRVMRESYAQFCNERTHACQSAFISSVANHANPVLAKQAQTMMSDWSAREGCALEKAYSQWESKETQALGSIFSLWLQRFNRITTQVLTRVKADLRSEAQRELETWKRRERKSLLADMARVSVVRAGEQQTLHQELLAVKQQYRAEVARREAAARESEDLRRRAESAEAEVKRQAARSAARAQKQPVFSRRHELLSKRLHLEAPSHPVLGAFEGELFAKIKRARSIGAITAQDEEDMHRKRKAGNRAAHDPIGSFGTQVPCKEAVRKMEADVCSGGSVDASQSDDDDDYDYDDVEGFG